MGRKSGVKETAQQIYNISTLSKLSLLIQWLALQRLQTLILSHGGDEAYRNEAESCARACMLHVRE